MPNQPAGSQWLKEHYGLSRYTLTHSSYVGSNASFELTSKGNVEQVYGRKYAPAQQSPLAHLEFSLKYDDLNLDFLNAIFERLPVEEIVRFIEASPYGQYARKIGFLYECLTGKVLSVDTYPTGNYTDLLDPTAYVTGNPIKNARWHIKNNLLGTAQYCPMVRRTKELTHLLSQNIPQEMERLKNDFSPDILRRAANYLYSKETKSSFEIEKEQPSTDRTERFIALLMRAGSEETTQLLDEPRLVQLQNAIVDSRFAATGFRDFQNFIGQSLANYEEMIHYICPPPAILASLMRGLQETAAKTAGIAPEVRAAVLSFGFVFIHPFEDGNGRLHRFLIHDILVHDGVVPKGLIIPVSAHMLNNMRAYDQILENYSKPLMLHIRYTRKPTGGIAVTNAREIEGYFRYPDLTEQCIYLAQVILDTLKNDMPDELQFIQRYDEAKREIQQIVDMPDKDIDRMIVFLHQNKGIFPKRRRDYFQKLTDEEIAYMQSAYRRVFELDPEI